MTDVDRAAITAGLALHVARHGAHVPIGGGKVVSRYDLHRYVENNPELAALAAQRPAGFDTAGAPPRGAAARLRDAAPWLLTPAAAVADLPKAWADRMGWARRCAASPPPLLLLRAGRRRCCPPCAPPPLPSVRARRRATSWSAGRTWGCAWR